VIPSYHLHVSGNSYFAGNATTTGIVAFTAYDCSGNANGGVLTVDANGQVVCDDDDAGGGGDTMNVGTLTGDITLTAGVDDVYQYLNPNGSTRIVTIDTSSATVGVLRSVIDLL